jgi:chromosome partitioning protein
MDFGLRLTKKPRKSHIIVVGNEKGGSGKTTTIMHLVTALLRLGFKVGSIDIDARQRSLTRYLENRNQTMDEQKIRLPMPTHHVLPKSISNIVQEAEEDERERFEKVLDELSQEHDFVVVDSPGNDTYMSRLAHSHADTIITPINDSFVDLDVLGKVDGTTLKVQKPSIYSEMIWEQKLKRAKRDGGSIDWIVMRNRLSNIDARNKRFMSKAVQELSRRIGFRLAPGFSERVIFRELFLQGLTVLDVIDTSSNVRVSISHVAARQEVRDLLNALKLPQVDERISNMRVNAEEEERQKEKTAQKQAEKSKEPAQKSNASA